MKSVQRSSPVSKEPEVSVVFGRRHAKYSKKQTPSEIFKGCRARGVGRVRHCMQIVLIDALAILLPQGIQKNFKSGYGCCSW